MSGHPQDIATPASQIIVAGDEATWQAHRTTIELLAGQTLYLGGDAAVASALDLALVGCFQTVGLCAFVEPAAYASSYGLDVRDLSSLAGRLLAKMQAQVAVLADTIASKEYATDQATVGVYVAALEQVRSPMLAVDVPARLTSAALANSSSAVAAGHGGMKLGAHVEHLRGRSARSPQGGRDHA